MKILELDLSHEAFILHPSYVILGSWCPRKDLNLQPLVCRTSAPSVELLGREMVVGVGIEPTFRAFQTRANPSQLSDREEGNEFLTPSAFARCAPFQ